MLKIMLDTNVLLDFYLGRNSCDDVARMLAILESRGDAIYVTALSLKDVFYIIPRALRPATDTSASAGAEKSAASDPAETWAREEIAWACIKDATEHFLVAKAGEQEVLRARSLRALHSDFEDNLQVATAESLEVDFFITLDTGLRVACPLATMTPSQMKTYLEAADS
jgi:predicted nucleic acid-binding protein